MKCHVQGHVRRNGFLRKQEDVRMEQAEQHWPRRAGARLITAILHFRDQLEKFQERGASKVMVELDWHKDPI